MTQRVGVSGYRYEHVEGWGEFPRGGVVSDVATDSEDRVYACVRLRQGPDGNEGEMWVFDRNGKLLDRWGRDIFEVPHGLFIHDDVLYHADAGDHTVRSFSPDGKTLMVLGTEGKQGPEGEPFRSPTNATIAVSGDLYVSDGYEQNRCHRFTTAGELKHSWGGGDAVYYQKEVHGEVTGVVGDGPGEFNLPHGIVTDSSGQVYVMDRENGRVQVFTEEGEYMTEWNDVPGGNDAVIDGEGMMHIAAGQEGVFVKTLDGETVGSWGERGEETGRFSGYPHGIWIDSQGDVYVAQVGAQLALDKFARV